MELRHSLWKADNGWRYGPWRIAPADWIRPSAALDWDWWHKDLDEDDTRYGYAETRDACIEAIHEWEDGQ